MRKLQRIVSTLLIASVLSGMTVMEALASSVISSVSIRVESNLEAGDDLPGENSIQTDSGLGGSSGIAVYTSSSKYHVEQVDWISDTHDIGVGDTPKMRVYLEPDDVDEHYFRGSYGSSNVTIKGGSFVSARREDDQLVVTLKMDPIKGDFDPPENVEWRDSGLGRAQWENPDNSSRTYDVYLYRGNSAIKKVEGLNATSYNFYPYMTKEGTYYFKVRTVPKKNSNSSKSVGKRSEWVESDEIYISEEDVSDGSGQSDGTGSSNGSQVGWIRDGDTWYYRFPDGSYQKNNWLQLNGKWYLFDSVGRMLTGWQTKNNNTYLLKDSGEMATGWYQKDNTWYYLNEQPGSTQGVIMKDSWVYVNNKWYLLDSEGRMMTGWQNKNGYTYFLNSSGEMKKGWINSGSQWYYMSETQTAQFPEGALCKNAWIQQNGNTYYVNDSGVMAEGWTEISGSWYYFYPNDGKRAANTKIGDFYIDANGIWQR